MTTPSDWVREEGCKHCLRVFRVNCAMLADFVIVLSVLVIIKLSHVTIVALFKQEFEAKILQGIDFAGKAGLLLLLAALLLWDIWKECRRKTSPPCPTAGVSPPAEEV